MNDDETLYALLKITAKKYPHNIAVQNADKNTITYKDLDDRSDTMAVFLRNLGIQKGDRIGLYVKKNFDSLTTIFGILKAGAGYVPVDPDAPSQRNDIILNDCSVRFVFVEKQLYDMAKNF